MTLKPQFGIFLVPMANHPDELFQQAKIADHNGLDLLFIQDHPHQPRFFETWTLLIALAMKTERIHISPGVADLPLRLPSVLAKRAASVTEPTYLPGNQLTPLIHIG